MMIGLPMKVSTVQPSSSWATISIANKGTIDAIGQRSARVRNTAV